MKQHEEYLAKLLQVPVDRIEDFEKNLANVSGKDGVLEKLAEEWERRARNKVQELGLTRNGTIEAPSLFEALVRKTNMCDQMFYRIFHEPVCTTFAGCKTILNAAKELFGSYRGFFLKKEKAIELLQNNPPQKILEILGYDSMAELLEREDLFEIFAALRLVEDPWWLNTVFFRAYENLVPSDFEERDIRASVLSKQWAIIGERFVSKKFHHISHLKELGFIFFVPEIDYFGDGKYVAGQTLELFTLILHYFHEVKFYSELFRRYSKTNEFSHRLVLALSGYVREEPLPHEKGFSFRIIQQYLAKHDSKHPFLFEPHVNPEVFHWGRAVAHLIQFARRFPETELGFWEGLEAVGLLLPYETEEPLVSFDFIDNVLALRNRASFDQRYTYHFQEALWTNIVQAYLGKERLESLIGENLHNGYITL